MKKILSLVFIAVMLTMLSCANQNNPNNNYNSNDSTTSDSDSFVAIKYQPMQCKKTPWQLWSDDTNDLRASAMYYKENFNISIVNFQRIERDILVCQACDICPETHYFSALVRKSVSERIVSIGWKLG